jgi:hypothetical protein
MFFLGHSGIILSLLLTLAFPFVFLFPGKQTVVNRGQQVGELLVIDIKNSEVDSDFSINLYPGKFKSTGFLFYFSADSGFACRLKRIRYQHNFVFRACKTTCLNECGNKAPPTHQF